MTYSISTEGLTFDGLNYPFVKPDGFDEWLKTKQDAFIQGILHVYTVAPAPPPTPQPTQEQLL